MQRLVAAALAIASLPGSPASPPPMPDPLTAEAVEHCEASIEALGSDTRDCQQRITDAQEETQGRIDDARGTKDVDEAEYRNLRSDAADKRREVRSLRNRQMQVHDALSREVQGAVESSFGATGGLGLLRTSAATGTSRGECLRQCPECNCDAPPAGPPGSAEEGEMLMSRWLACSPRISHAQLEKDSCIAREHTEEDRLGRRLAQYEREGASRRSKIGHMEAQHVVLDNELQSVRDENTRTQDYVDQLRDAR